MSKTLAFLTVLTLAAPAPASAQVADVKVHPTRTIHALAPGTGVSQVCAVAPGNPTVPLGCIGADEAATDQEVALDVTAWMVAGTQTCFRAIALSPEGLMSEPSENQACGTLPRKPVLK